MKKDEPRRYLGEPRGEGGDAAEERMEDWYGTGVTEFEEGEVVRGRDEASPVEHPLLDEGGDGAGMRQGDRRLRGTRGLPAGRSRGPAVG